MTRMAAAERWGEGGGRNARCWVDSDFKLSAFNEHKSTTTRSTTISTTKRENRQQTSFNKTDGVLKSFNVHRIVILSDLGNYGLRVQGLSLGSLGRSRKILSFMEAESPLACS
jgi:hypothetical protein